MFDIRHVRENTLDSWIANQVIHNNEYHLTSIRSDQLVIDIGAHIGSFSIAAYNHGARNILAIEPDLENYFYLRSNVADLDVKTMQCAVWRSDITYPHTMKLNNPNAVNTGDGNVFFVDDDNHNLTQVNAIALDDLIGDNKEVILKLDCESSEWPILFTSRKLKQVNTIVGEFHEVGGNYDSHIIPEQAQVKGFDSFTADILKEFLKDRGFTVTIERFVTDLTTLTPSNMGHFYAKKAWW